MKGEQDPPGAPSAGESFPPARGEAQAWGDWIGSAQASQLDPATRTFVHSAFAAGFEAGWRDRDDQQPPAPAS
jgi:hypothetical protein